MQCQSYQDRKVNEETIMQMWQTQSDEAMNKKMPHAHIDMLRSHYVSAIEKVQHISNTAKQRHNNKQTREEERENTSARLRGG